MRIWHKDLISVLPRKQLLGQWRELNLICKSIAENDSPNHILVNKVLDYPVEHLQIYIEKIIDEMIVRGYLINAARIMTYIEKIKFKNILPAGTTVSGLFDHWHTDRYLKQCLYNLQEKYDCNGMSKEEWKLIYDKYKKIYESDKIIY